VRANGAVVGCLIAIACVVDASAQQTRADQSYRPPPQVFDRLFRQCSGCPPSTVHMVIDSPLLTDGWLARHGLRSNGSSFGDNAVVADLWYDPVHRRLFTRSLVMHEVDDPADLRLGRAPGIFPDRPDFKAELKPGTTVGHVGFVPWTSNGFGAYFAAVQGAVYDETVGFLDLSTTTGISGVTRTGSTYAPNDLIKHVRLHPSGQLEIGYETDPAARPDASLLVRGNVEIEGSLTVAGSGVSGNEAPPAVSCSVRSGGGTRTAAVACGAGQFATGGGGACSDGEMRASRPVLYGEAPAGWEVTCSRDGSHSVYVICCSQ